MIGFFNIVKPTGLTASDVVVRMRKITGVQRIGHLGTLDPGAGGVLPLAVGRATKLFDFLTFKQKSYRAFFSFGVSTDTLDSYGMITETKPSDVTMKSLNEAMMGFIGKIKQIPPIYSSISIGGTRSYSLARAGKEVDLPEREVEIFELKLLRQDSKNTFVVDITCGGGTYIRSLVRDIAYSLGTVGYLSALIRTGSGLFSLSDAVTFDEVAKDTAKHLLPIEFPLSDLTEHIFDERYYKQLANGVKLVIKPFLGTRRIICCNKLLGIGHCDENSKLIIDVFFDEEKCS